MNRLSKFILVLIGIVLIVVAGFEISRIYSIPVVTASYLAVLTNYPATFETLLLVLVGIVGLVGLVLIVIGVFRPTKVKQLTFANHIGQLVIPATAIERDLGYQLTDQYHLVGTDVAVELSHNNQAKVKIAAKTNHDVKFDELAKKMSQTAVAYLERRLDLKAVKPVVELTPAAHQEKITVV